MDDSAPKRENIKWIPFNDLDPDRVVVSMVEYKDNIYVATQRGIYRLEDNVLVRLKFKEVENPTQTKDL